MNPTQTQNTLGVSNESVNDLVRGIENPSYTHVELHNAKEVAALSQALQNQGSYERHQDKLALSLRESINSGVYRRTAVKTAPPPNIMQNVRQTRMNAQ